MNQLPKMKFLPTKIGMVIKRVGEKLEDRVTCWFPEQCVKDFMRHNKSIWGDWKTNNTENLILFDFYPLSETEIARSYLLNVLARKYNATIVSYCAKRRRKRYGIWRRIYRSFNVSKNISLKLDARQKEESRALFKEAIQKISTKKDLFDLTIAEVWIGVDIYEDYLYRFAEPTVKLDDPRLDELIKEGIYTWVFWRDFFRKNRVKAIVSSHIATRIEKSIPCKIAGQIYGIPFYSTHARTMTHYPKPHLYHEYVTNQYKNYPRVFRTIPLNARREGINWAKERLKRRLSGEVGVDMAYSEKSAFKVDKNDKPVLKISNNKKILICTHEFYDGPHCYGNLLFVDFYEWLTFLGEFSRETDYDWYIKTHPDSHSETRRIVKNLVDKYEKFNPVPADTSHHQLVDEGIEVVLTCYGSVGHEYPLLGVPVINAGNNPHLGYRFNIHPESLQKYKDILLNLNDLQFKINPEEIYEFYFMHYGGAGIIDDWIYPSYSKMVEDLTEEQRFGFDILPYFLQRLDAQRHQKIVSRFTDFIDSGKIGAATFLDFNEKN